MATQELIELKPMLETRQVIYRDCALRQMKGQAHKNYSKLDHDIYYVNILRERDYCTSFRQSNIATHFTYACTVAPMLKRLSLNTTVHTFRYKYIFSGHSFNFLKSDSSWKEFAGMAGTGDADLNDVLLSLSICLFTDGCNTDEIPLTPAGSLQKDVEICNL